MKDLQFFCAHLFTSLSFDQRGQIRVCCNNYEVPKGEDGKPILISDKDFSMKKVFNSDVHTRIRKNIIENNPDPGCFRCWQTEENGAESYRTIWNNTLASGFYKDIMIDSVDDVGHIESPYVTFLDFTVGNKCNLVCRMCNVDNSHLWEKEEKLLYGEENVTPPSSNVSVDERFLSDEFFEENLMHVKQVNFLGGEPLIVNEHEQFLNQCIKHGISKNIVLFYTTNLIKLDDKWLEKWKHFRHIYLGVSVDGYKEVNDYIRYPSKWKQVIQSIEKVSEWKKELSMDLQIHATFQAMNALNYDKLLEWVFSLGDLGFWRIPFSNWVTYPNHYDSRILPGEIKNDAVDRIQKFIDDKADVEWTVGEKQWLGILKSNMKTIMEDFDDDVDVGLAFEKLKIFTKKLDISRKQHIVNFIPELKTMIYGGSRHRPARRYEKSKK